MLALYPRLEARLTNFGAQFSGGEQQMLSIGRALMTHPDVMILDEATEGLSCRSSSLRSGACSKAFAPQGFDLASERGPVLVLSVLLLAPRQTEPGKSNTQE